MKTIIVTRHPALVDLIKELGLVSEGESFEIVADNATVEQVKGNRIIGVLPPQLAAEAHSVTAVPVDFNKIPRGAEIDLETLRKVTGTPFTYTVKIVWDHVQS